MLFSGLVAEQWSYGNLVSVTSHDRSWYITSLELFLVFLAVMLDM